MVEYKTPGEIDAMHAAGQVVARILEAVREQAAPGTRLSDLDETARQGELCRYSPLRRPGE